MQKNSVKSSEFIMTVASMVLMIANGTEYVNIPWDTLTWFLGANALYIAGAVGRKVSVVQGNTKVAQANAAVLVAKEKHAAPMPLPMEGMVKNA
jgi:hypothetical protein